MSFTIDATGITTPSASEVRELIVALWREAYGTGAQTASETPDGLMIDLITVVMHSQWEAAVHLFNNSFFATAELDQLILILEPFGVKQIPASPSTVTLVHVASANVTVPAGHLVQVGASGGTFSTDASVGTEATVTQPITVLYVNPPAPAYGGSTLEIEYGGPTITITDLTSPATAVELATIMRDGLNANGDFTSAATAYLAGSDDSGRARLVLVGNTAPPTSVSITGSTPWADHEANAGTSTATATVDGATVGPVGEVDSILTPVVNLIDSFNYVAATEGRLDETASEMRARWLDILAAGGCATASQVRRGLLENVEGMIDVGINENESSTDFTGSGGLPPHSFEAVIHQSPIGGPFTAEQDLAIATEIYRCKPLGIQSYGDTVVTVVGAVGPRDIGFSRVEPLDLWIEVDITKGEGFPTEGDPKAALEAAIFTYYTSGAGKLGKGDDFEHATMGGPVVTTIPQIKGIVVRSNAVTVGSGSGVLDANDEIAGDDQILIPSPARILVTIL